MCKTLPINYKIPAAASPLLLLPCISCCICMRLQSNYKIVEAMLYSNYPKPTPYPPCIRRHSSPSSPAMKSSRCRCRNRNPKRICSCLSPSLLAAEFAVIGKGQGAGRGRSREQQLLRSVAHLNLNLKHLHSSSVSSRSLQPWHISNGQLKVTKGKQDEFKQERDRDRERDRESRLATVEYIMKKLI